MQRDGIYDDVSLLLARDAVQSTWNAPEHTVTANADAALSAAVDGVILAHDHCRPPGNGIKVR